MTDDIVTRLRAKAEQREPWDMIKEPVFAEAADEIERLRTLAHNLYEETKRCGTTHDTQATWDYEQWLEDND